MLWQLGVLADWGETPPPMAGSFLLLGKGLSGSTSLIYKPTNPKLWPQPHPYLTFTHQANISPALNHPQARYQTTIDHLSTPKPTRIIQTDQSQAVYPAMPFISWRNPQKVCGLSLPLVPICLLTNTGTFPCGPAWHVLTPSLGPVNIVNLLLNMVLFSCGHTNFVTAPSTPTFLQYVPSTSHKGAIRQCLEQVSHHCFLKDHLSPQPFLWPLHLLLSFFFFSILLSSVAWSSHLTTSIFLLSEPIITSLYLHFSSLSDPTWSSLTGATRNTPVVPQIQVDSTCYSKGES